MKLPPAAYSAEVATSATKAGSGGYSAEENQIACSDGKAVGLTVCSPG
jgi:hypothetical protein